MIATLTGVLAASILGSLHCAGMCGPLAAIASSPSAPVQLTDDHASLRRRLLAAQIEDGLEDLDFLVGGAPGAAKKIRKLGPTPVRNHMNSELEELVLHPDTPILEVIRKLTRYGSPLPVVEENSMKFVGLVSGQTCLKRLHEILGDVEREEAGQ